MKFKNIFITTVLGVFLFSFAPISYALTDEMDVDANINIYPLTDEIVGGEDVDESEVLPPSDEEYVISSTTEPVFEMEDGVSTRNIRSQSVSFIKTSATKAKLAISISSSSSVTKLNVKAYLYKKVGSASKYTGQKISHTVSSRELTGKSYFSVEKNANYKVKIVVTEYVNKKSYPKTPYYKALSKNGY